MENQTTMQDDRNFVRSKQTAKQKKLTLFACEDELVQLQYALAFVLGNKSMSEEEQTQHLALTKKFGDLRIVCKYKKATWSRNKKQNKEVNSNDTTESSRSEDAPSTSA